MDTEAGASVVGGEDAGGWQADLRTGPADAVDAVDAELAEVMTDLQIRSLGYQAALAVTAQVMQPSLLDFLR